MPFLLLIIGLLFISTATRGSAPAFGQLIQADLMGSGERGSKSRTVEQRSFLAVAAGFVAVIAIGYWEPAKPYSRALLALMLLSVILTNQRGGGLIERGTQQLDLIARGVNEQNVVARSNGPNGLAFWGDYFANMIAGITGANSQTPDAAKQR